MTNSTDYRLYLEEHFKRLDDKLEGQTKLANAQFEIVYDKLDEIKTDTGLTNSRVTHLEEEKAEYLKSRVDKSMLKDVNDKVICIDEKLAEYYIAKKYPKLMIILLAVFLIGFVFSAVSVFQNFKGNIKQDTIIEKTDSIDKDISNET